MASTCLIFSESGLGKTSNCAYWAKYIYEKTRKKVRYISADGGGWQPLQPLINAGLVEPLSLIGVPQPHYVLRKLSKGWWPDEVTPEGHWVGTKMIEVPKAKLAEEFGGFIFEGLTSFSDLLMRHFAGKKLAESGAFAFKEGEGEGVEQFGSAARDHYGFVQNEMLGFLVRIGGLPVSRALCTAHEAQAEDEDTKKPIRGPALAGNKGTPRVAKNVGEVIHLEGFVQNILDPQTKKPVLDPLTGQPLTKPLIRGYFTPHADVTFPNIIYKACKARVEPSMMPKLLEKYPGGFFESTIGPEGSGIDAFLRAEDELLERGTDEVRRWMESLQPHSEEGPKI
jgi:hypothetical protein